ncbi:MAG: cytochrome b/b6 domain-containing protein [Chloroflexi bacterium]|nr:cytochrome b/b6 domain-containing protein [Chloroflexota bacterium]
MTTSPAETGTTRPEPEYFTRFSLSQRIEHAVLMVTFTILAVTGLAQRFYSMGWAEWIILNLGGIEYTRLIHRGFGFLFTASVLYHLVYVTHSLLWRHAKPSMLPTLKDARDVVTTLRYSLGFTDKPPQFGRYDYRQKFEYWGIIFGGAIIILSGFFLMFPLVVTRFLPGQFIAAAVEFHGWEATLAVLTIIVWHTYDTIFKPVIFPMDTSIFTGKISRERMIEEHPLEYAELMGQQSGPTPPPQEEPAPERAAMPGPSVGM